MLDQSFERRLGALFLSDAARAIPEGTSVRSAIDRRLGHRTPVSRPSLLMISSLAVIVLALIISITPARATVANLLPFGWLQRFGTVLVTPTPTPGRLPPNVGTKPTAIPQGHALSRLTLAEAQALASFRIPQPSFLPAGVVFEFAFASPENATVVLSYGRAGNRSSGMFIQIEQGSPGGGYQIPAAQARTVKVHGHDAVYARGAWNETQHWNGAADSALLSWQEGGFTYVMSYSGLGLSQADMIRIAESVR